VSVRALLLVCVVFLSCAKRPCEPWVSNGLAELADPPAVRIEHCDPKLLRFRVMPGGTVDAFLAQSASFADYNGWRFWKRTAWIRSGQPAMRMTARMAGDDLVAEVAPDASIDVASALSELSADGGT
jgi:hypothetical protein